MITVYKQFSKEEKEERYRTLIKAREMLDLLIQKYYKTNAIVEAFGDINTIISKEKE
jgi:hypothetical protein